MESWSRLLSLAVLLLMAAGKVESQLRPDFYASTCPDVESIVREEVRKKFVQTFVTVPATLRLFFHDCFVEGCDASVIIASPNGDAEKDADENISLAGDGFDTVVKAKTAVESRCPGVVSCADILALATRDVVVLTGGPSFAVELGRLDGLISQRSRVAGKLPKPDQSLDELNAIFKQNNLTETDVIILSGAHTLGFAHCGTFSDRLYSNPDPTLNADFARQLQDDCPRNVDPLVAINLDVNTPRTFDNVFYSNLVEGKGLLRSDQVLFSDPRSRSKVVEFAGDAAGFGAAFADAMVRLGRVGVKTGGDGEIRRDCTAFN